MFFSAFFVHCMVWQVVIPYSAIKVLLALFHGLWIVWFLFFLNFPFEINIIDVATPKKLSEYTHITSLYLCFSLTYILFYQALIEPGPSCSIVMLVAKAGGKGMEGKSFYKVVSDNTLVKPRIEYLLNNRLAFMHHGKYCLTHKGLSFVRVFAFYRNFVRLQKYGG